MILTFADVFLSQVIVADNYFTGSKDNLRKWIGHPRFELIRHGSFLFSVTCINCSACPFVYPLKQIALGSLHLEIESFSFHENGFEQMLFLVIMFLSVLCIVFKICP